MTTGLLDRVKQMLNRHSETPEVRQENEEDLTPNLTEAGDVIPVVLVAGFLGAGKTTLMRRIIDNAKVRGMKFALIVNEFGAVDVDTNILREADAEFISSLEGGCACCEGVEELLTALYQIATRPPETRPDVIFMESSGLSDPMAMLDVMTLPDMLPLIRVASLISVVDPLRFHEPDESLMPLLIRQIQMADILVLNKMDIIPEESRNTFLADLEALLRRVNLHAPLLPAIECRANLTALWEQVRNIRVAPAERDLTSEYSKEAAAHAHYRTVALNIPRAIERRIIEQALHNLEPSIWRVKGFLRLRGEKGLYLLQCFAGYTNEPPQYQLIPIPADYEVQPPTTLVFIGAKLDEARILHAFSGLTPLPLHGEPRSAALPH